MSEKPEMFMDDVVIAELHILAQTKYPNQKCGVTLTDPSCCGGVIRINVEPISEIQKFIDIQEIFPENYKNFGMPIYIDNATMENPIPRMRILLKSKNPLKFEFENEDFYKK